MSAVRLAFQTFVCFNLVHAIISQGLNKYCVLKSECELEFHIGCAYDTLRSSGYEIEHFKYSDRLSILNILNQFRSDIAVGNPKFRPEPFPNMNKILWSYELEKLLKISIRKVSNGRFPCILTTPSDKIAQFFFNLNIPKSSFTIEATLNDLLPNITRQASANYRTASIDDNIAYSYLFNPNTSTMGCAMGSKINSGQSSSLKSVILRCAFNGTKIDKNNLKNQNGWPCSQCNLAQMSCDEFFPGLCVPGILKGYKGNPGVRGYIGVIGQIGDLGNAGEKGEDGTKGLPGLIGLKGETGINGDNGATSALGLKGNKGEPGQEIRGIPGLQGIRGMIGNEGMPGKPGEIGPPGQKGDLNHSKGEKGVDGSKFQLPGEKGDKGHRGFAGKIGIPGAPGIQGPQGASPVITKEQLLENCGECPIGPTGPQGPIGIPGPKGKSFINNIGSESC